VNELTVFRLVSIHNLRYTLGLLADARAAIVEGRFAAFREGVVARRASPDGAAGRGD
jgi:tRNA-guanine family transglycosylase